VSSIPKQVIELLSLKTSCVLERLYIIAVHNSASPRWGQGQGLSVEEGFLGNVTMIAAGLSEFYLELQQGKGI